MKFYFDESGSFSVKNPGPHIMVGILFPENKENELRKFFNSFISNLSPNEFINNEPKGSSLNDNSREQLFNYIRNNNWLRIAISLTDSEFNDENVIQGFKNAQLDLYQQNLINQQNLNADNDLLNLQNQLITNIQNLNEVLIVKGFLLMHTLYALLRNSVNAFESQEFDECWRDFSLTFDRQNRDTITPMENWVNLEFMHFISENNRENPIELPASWENRNHPFIANFRDGINQRLVLNNIFSNRFQFEDSTQTYGLQIVDCISNTVFKVFRFLSPIELLDRINNNLVGYRNTRINLIQFYNADALGLQRKYQDFLH